MDSCIFCMIAAGDIPSRRIYEDESCIAILDVNPAAEGHTLIIPKEHHKDITEVDEAVLGHLFGVAKMVGTRQKERLNADGFNVVQNNGAAAGQTVPHFHIHVIPRFENDGQAIGWVPTEPSAEELDAALERLS